MLIESLVVPPGGPLLAIAAGVLLTRRAHRRGHVGWAGRTLLAVGLVSLFLASTPLVGGALLRSLQGEPGLDGMLHARPPSIGDEPRALRNPQGDVIGPDGVAIVVLGGDVLRDAEGVGRSSVGALTLQRLQGAAALSRVTGWPILVSGGSVEGVEPIARLMQHSLEQDFAIDVRWVEDRSANTRENLIRTAELLAREEIEEIVLVTHAWHLRRATLHAERAGLRVWPCPVAPHPGWRGWFPLVPSSRALRDTALACHEWLGIAWATVRGD